MTTGIILFTRAPIPGKTKTRLQSHLTAEQCAGLHRAFLADMNDMLIKLQKKHKNINLYLFYTPENNKKVFKRIISDSFTYYPQKGSNIGDRMYNSLEKISEENNKQILIGSDLPTLQPEIIENTIAKLKENDIVIGPANDGGYYLIGCKRPHKKVFKNINWGSSNVLKETIKVIKKNNLNYNTVPNCLDIDYYNDLIQLYRQLENPHNLEFYPKNTAQIIYRIFNEQKQLKKGSL